MTQDIRIDCSSNEPPLFENQEFVAWLDRLKTFLKVQTDNTARLRMYAYEHGGATWVALDIFCDDSQKDVTITACITPAQATVCEPIGEQIDMELPGLIEVLDFASHLVEGDGSGHLQLSSWQSTQLNLAT